MRYFEVEPGPPLEMAKLVGQIGDRHLTVRVDALAVAFELGESEAYHWVGTTCVEPSALPLTHAWLAATKAVAVRRLQEELDAHFKGGATAPCPECRRILPLPHAVAQFGRIGEDFRVECGPIHVIRLPTYVIADGRAHRVFEDLTPA